LGKGRSFVLSPKAMISKTGGRNVHPPPIDRDKAMNKSDAIKILNDYNKWRRGGDDEALMPEPFDIGLAIDAAVKFLGEDGWMPIDDKAKNGTVLAHLFEDHSPQPVLWDNEAKGYKSLITERYVMPTHWMPLPPQPKEQKR